MCKALVNESGITAHKVYAYGIGGSVKVTNNVKLSAAYFQTFYDTFKKEYTQDFSAAGQTITAECRDEFTRTNKVFAVGVDIDF